MRCPVGVPGFESLPSHSEILIRRRLSDFYSLAEKFNWCNCDLGFMGRSKSIDLLLASVLILILTGSGSALSCVADRTTSYNLHCPEESSCESAVNITGDIRENVVFDSEELPEPGESFSKNISEEASIDRSKEKAVISVESNRDLPSQGPALESARSMCPSPAPKHLYPKEDFNRTELQDTTRCYETQVENLESHYLVWREGTTDGWNCVEKVGGQMVSGGETRYAAPAGPIYYLGKALEIIAPF